MTDQDRLALLPCPFCGGEAAYYDCAPQNAAGVNCTICGVDIDPEEGASRAEARTRWNTRALAQSGGEPVAWIARDPDGGPYLTWSKSAAHAFPNPTALYATPIAGESGAWREALEEIKRLLGYVANEGKSPAVKESNANMAWHVADRALASAPQPAAAPQPDVREALVNAFLPKCQAFGKGDMPLHVAGEFADTAIAALTPPQPAAGEREEMRPKAFLAWAVEMFGPVAKLRSERLMRFIEEAIELAHADEMERHTLEAIANRVYARPKGTVNKEIGQAQACLETYAENIGESSDLLAEIEWQRVQQIPRSEWERRHTAKRAIGIAEPSLMPARETGNADNVRK